MVWVAARMCARFTCLHMGVPGYVCVCERARVCACGAVCLLSGRACVFSPRARGSRVGRRASSAPRSGNFSALVSEEAVSRWDAHPSDHAHTPSRACERRFSVRVGRLGSSLSISDAEASGGSCYSFSHTKHASTRYGMLTSIVCLLSLCLCTCAPLFYI